MSDGVIVLNAVGVTVITPSPTMIVDTAWLELLSGMPWAPESQLVIGFSKAHISTALR